MGHGKNRKFGPIKKLIAFEKPSFVALQETKLHTINDSWVQSLWGSTNCNFIQQEAIGKSGGQLLIWDSNLFDPSDVIALDRVIGIRGVWKDSGECFNVLNVYGPHDDVKKQQLWDSLSRLLQVGNEAWVICGDLNEVRDHSERFKCDFVASRARQFNDFINLNNLLDIPLGGRLFTRVSDDGTKFSKLNRFLVSDNFSLLWCNLSAVILDRSESDHCPIVLKDEVQDYGPKPFKVFDAWFDEVGIDKLISDTWVTGESGTNVTGICSRKDRVFLNKLKQVKLALKSWHKAKFGQLDGEIETNKQLAQSLEIKAESVLLDPHELDMWRTARKCWMDKMKIKTEMLKQKARVR
ncbi:uncharacterized protein [Rutidosis leptorrhynchoides]|uniref:uncharacterized protein n=1 Tax=Rutidosis leptorrhynchoides TaxID=125765 RepID=UPI003A9A0B49